MCKLPERGIVTIAFDDAYSATYKHAIRYLDKLHIKSTIALPASLIGKTFENRPIVRVKDIAKSNHEIASHTLTHPNLLSLNSENKKAIDSELSDSKKLLEKTLRVKVESFVFPYINKNQSKALRLKTSNYYKSARITSDRPCFNKLPIEDPYSLEGFAVMKKHSLPYLNKQIDYAAKNKCWLIEVFHLVSNKNTLSASRPKPYRFFTHIDDFKKHIDYIRSKNVLILTQKDVVKKWTTKN